MSEEEKYYLELANHLLITKSKAMVIAMYIEAIKRLDKINELLDTIRKEDYIQGGGVIVLGIKDFENIQKIIQGGSDE